METICHLLKPHLISYATCSIHSLSLHITQPKKLLVFLRRNVNFLLKCISIANNQSHWFSIKQGSGLVAQHGIIDPLCEHLQYMGLLKWIHSHRNLCVFSFMWLINGIDNLRSLEGPKLFVLKTELLWLHPLIKIKALLNGPSSLKCPKLGCHRGDQIVIKNFRFLSHCSISILHDGCLWWLSLSSIAINSVCSQLVLCL